MYWKLIFKEIKTVIKKKKAPRPHLVSQSVSPLKDLSAGQPPSKLTMATKEVPPLGQQRLRALFGSAAITATEPRL
jgi:hypothetical protein